MFDGEKFLTRGIASNIPVEIQMFIWSAIENMKSSDMDYLQVFDLFEEDGLQIIHHTSEVPPFDMTYILLYHRVSVRDITRMSEAVKKMLKKQCVR